MSNYSFRPCPKCGSRIISHILTLPGKKADRYCFSCENCGHVWSDVNKLKPKESK